MHRFRLGYLWSLLGGTVLLLGLFVLALMHERRAGAQAIAQVRAAVDGPYTASNTYDYYVVKSSVPAEDTGEEVCAALGLGCIGYTSYDNSVCTQVHPLATVDGAQVSGSKSGYYCDGPPQGGVCSGLTDTCAVCPSCNVGVSCFEPIGGLYREMYVQCAGTLGTNAYSAPTRPDDDGSSDLVATTLTDSTTFNTYGVVHSVATESDSVLFNDSYTDASAGGSAFSSFDGGVFVVHGHNDGGTGGRELYVAKVSAAGAVLWDTFLSNLSFFYGNNYLIDLVDDQNGGVFVLLGEGDVFAAPDIAPVLYYVNASGVVSYTVNTYPTSTNVGRMIPDGSGGVYVVSDFGFDSTFSYTGAGLVQHYTISGLDATYNSGNGFQEIISGGADANYLEVIPDGGGGLIALWVGDTSGTFGLHAQHIESDGSIDTDFSSAGELIYADASAFGPIEATIAGTHVYAAYQATAGIVTSEFFLDLTNAWVCRQSIPSGSNYNIINPLYSSPILIWQNSYGDGDAIFAQVYDAGTGHSGWALGGEVIDASDNYTTFTTLGVAIAGTPANVGFGTESGGVEIVYTYDDGVGVPITSAQFNSSTFPAGPGGDCLPILPPIAVSPAEDVVRTDTVNLSVRYRDAATPGTTDYRVSSSSVSDCTAGVNIVASATSLPTTTNDEVTQVQVSGFNNGSTYFWCARNDNGTDQSAWTAMYQFTMDVLTPNVEYLTYLGGSGVDLASDIALLSGIVYLTGETNSLDFPTTVGAFDTIVDSQDAFVAAVSLDAAGAADLQWLGVYGGSGDEFQPVIGVSGSAVYVAGHTTSSNVPTTVGAYDTSYNSGIDAFLALISTDGSTLQYGTYLGGSAAEVDVNLAVAGGDAYLALRTQSSGFPTTAGAYDTSFNTNQDIAVVRLSPDGAGLADLVYGSFIGTSGNEAPTGVAVDGGFFYVSGQTASASFPTTAGAYDTTDNPGQDGVIFRINPAGTGSADLTYSTYIGGNSSDAPMDIAVESGIIYVVGETFSTDFPTTSGAYQETEPGGFNSLATAFVINPAGAGSADLQYSTYLAGASGSQSLYGVAVSGGIMYAAGVVQANDFPVTANAFDPVFNDVGFGSDAAIVILDPAGTGLADLVYSSFLGTDEGDEVFNAVAFEAPYLYLAGEAIATYPVSFALGGTAYQQTMAGSREAYFGRINVTGGTPVPDAPVLLYPDNGASRAGVVVLAAQYSHPALVGTTEYRLSTTSTTNCINNISVIDSGSSATTTAISQPTTFTTISLSNGTYYWCARNNDGTNQSAWTAMGSFIKDSTVPYLNYASFLGGSDIDRAEGIATDGSYVYITGETESPNMPTSVGAYDTSLNATDIVDIFVVKMSLDGNGVSDFIAGTYYGGTSGEGMNFSHRAIAVTGGKVYVTGTTASSDLPLAGGTGGVPFDSVLNSADGFIARFSDALTTLEYATYFGGTASIDNPNAGILVDGTDVYLAGSTSSSTGFPLTAGAYDLTYNGGSLDFFVTKFSLAGSGSSDLLYGTYIGSAGQDTGASFDVVSGIVYLTGQVGSTGYPTTSGAYNTTSGSSAYVSKINPAGAGASDLLYSSRIPGTFSGVAVQYDAGLNVMYVFGETLGSFSTTAGAYDTSFNGGVDQYLVGIEPVGAGAADLVYATYIGAGSTETARDAILAGGDLYLLGGSNLDTFPTTSNAYSIICNCSGTDRSVFLRFSPDGAGASDLVYSTFLQYSPGGDSKDIVIDGTLAFISTSTVNNPVPVLSDPGTVYDSTFNGGSRDAYIIRFDFAGAAAPANSAPTAPTTLFSNNSNAQFGATNPTGITSATPVFSAICNDPDSGDILNKYRIQVSTVNNFATTVWDSGAPGTSMINCTAGSRSQNITFGGTPLSQDGTTYYWRIKFFDDEPSEGVFSETVSTNTFTMATSGGGGGGSSVQRLVQLNTIAAPVIGPVTVISPSVVRFQWSYGDTANILGFRLINDVNQVAVQQPSPTALAADEEGLAHNSLVSGRKVTAYNNSGESAPSATYPDAYTHMIPLTPKLVQREGQQIRVTINENVNNLSSGQSGIQFELISVNSAAAAAVLQSPWLTDTNYTFDGIDPATTYLLRSRGRNFNAIETIWSNTLSIPSGDIIPPAPNLAVSLMLTASDGQSLQASLNPNSVLSVEMGVSNNGEGTAENTLLTLPIPDYINYIPGTLSIDGRKQSDAADADHGQASNGAVSAIWQELTFGFGHTVRFQLGFDTPRLIEEFVATEKPIEQSLQRVSDVIAQAIAAANPQITLQAQASHSGDPNPVFSQPQQVQPDVAVLTPPPAPQPTPTPVPTPAPVPTQQQVQIINQVLQQEFPQPGQQTSQPPIPQGETTSSNNGGNFSVSTSSGSNQLTLNGSAVTNDDQIEFTGTTSEPFAVVTLIFNDSVTAIAVSDANGNWRTFVSASELGIQEGEELRVRVEAIAAKDDLRSERVEVADVLLSRGRSGQIVADFETRVSEQGFVSTINEAAKVIEAQEPAIQTTLVVSAPVLVASSVPLWGYLPYVPTLIYHFLAWLAGFLGRRKKKDEDHPTFGIVYDSITKLPLPLAIVRIYDRATNKLVSTVVTDKLGRYDVLLSAGEYRVEVSKPQYQFPSSIVTTAIDGAYDRVYNDKTGTIMTAQQSAAPHVPIDPINVKRQWELSFGVRKAWLAFQRAGNHLATPIMLVGFVMSVALVYSVPSRAANWVIFGLYGLTLASQLKLKPKILKAWGVVYDMATDAILPLVTIQLIEPAGSKVVTSRLTDYEGRFTFLPEPGQYIVKASKPGFTQVTEVVQGYGDRQPMPPQVHIEKPNQRIAGDVAMKQS